MASSPAVADQFEDTEVEAPKTRSCLRCRTDFESLWAGERICRRCKGTSAWREGNPASTHSSSPWR